MGPLSCHPCLPCCQRTSEQQGSLAPRALPRFVATTSPSATRSSPADFPGSLVIRPTWLHRFRGGTRRSSPVAVRALVTMLSLPPRQRGSPYQPVYANPCGLRPHGCGLGLWGSALSGPVCVHIRDGPVTCNPPDDGLVDGLQDLRFPASQPSKLQGFWLLPWRVCLPLTTPAFAGRTTPRESFDLTRLARDRCRDMAPRGRARGIASWQCWQVTGVLRRRHAIRRPRGVDPSALAGAGQRACGRGGLQSCPLSRTVVCLCEKVLDHRAAMAVNLLRLIVEDDLLLPPKLEAAKPCDHWFLSVVLGVSGVPHLARAVGRFHRRCPGCRSCPRWFGVYPRGSRPRRAACRGGPVRGGGRWRPARSTGRSPGTRPGTASQGCHLHH